jgi:hypothetical protein
MLCIGISCPGGPKDPGEDIEDLIDNDPQIFILNEVKDLLRFFVAPLLRKTPQD